MNSRSRLIGLFVLTLATVCRADADKDAAKNADDFLAALKIFELPEGKQAVAQSSWKANLDEVPVLLDQEKLFEGMFATDASGIVGYKRLLRATVQSKGGGQLTEKYLLVSYKDRQNGRWKVWAFIKIGGIDVDHEIDGAREALTAHPNYRNYAFWLAIGGKLLAAKQALAMAPGKYYQGEQGAYYHQQDLETIAAIQLICGP